MMNSDVLEISPSAFCVEKDVVWGIHTKLNYMFSFNLSTETTEIYSLCPYAVIGRESQYIGICKYGKSVYLVPCWESKLIAYDIETHSIKVVEEGYSEKGRFGKSIVLGEKLYCVPMYEDYFIVIDLKKGCIERKILWKYSFSENVPVIIDSFVFDNKIICVIKDCTDEVLILDENYNITRKKIQNNGEDLVTGCSSKEKMFLCNPKTGKIFQYDKNFVIRDSMMVKGFSIGKINIINEIIILDNVEKAEKSIYYLKKRYKKNESYEVEKSPWSYNGMHGLLCCYRGNTYYFDRTKNELYVIDEDNMYRVFKIKTNIQYLKYIFKTDIFNKEIILESNIKNLELFIRFVVGEN